MRRLLTTFAVCLLVLAGASCSEQEEDQAREQGGRAADKARDVAGDVADRAEDLVDAENVTMKEFAFEPADLKVKVGTRVVWINRGEAPHFAVADNGSFGKDAKPLSKGKEMDFRFTQAGEFTYFCGVHFDEMKGKITVTS